MKLDSHDPEDEGEEDGERGKLGTTRIHNRPKRDIEE